MIPFGVCCFYHVSRSTHVARVRDHTSLTLRGTDFLNFRIACDQVAHLETAANLDSKGFWE